MRARASGASAPKGEVQLPQSLRAALSHLGLLAAVGAVLALAYLLFVILSGTLSYPIVGGSALEQLTRNVGLATSVFLWCLWIVVLTGMVRHYRTESSGVIVTVVGIACCAVFPAVTKANLSEESAAPLRTLAQSMVVDFQTSGAILIVLGLLRVVVGRVILLSGSVRTVPSTITRAGAARIAVERASQRPSAMRSCWELQFCRGNLRTNCARFLEGISCWKKKSGCYCDQGLATSLLSALGEQRRGELAEELDAAQQRSRRISQTRRPAARAKNARPPCGECPIYLDHQNYKYRVLSWLSYPVGAAILGIMLGPLRAGYDWVYSHCAGLGVSIDRIGQGDVYYLPQWISFENAMMLVIGLAVVGVVLQITEVFIFRFKW